jgi:nitrite reductase/ring-hydroxylating ferredoxin subunit
MAERERLICASDELVDKGKGVRFSVRWYGVDTPAFAIRYAGRVHGYLNRCTHVPVELDWQAGEFFDAFKLYLICAVHGAMFAPDTGRCMGGRCEGRGLTPLHLEERPEGVFLIEKSD